jgi:hypothetical protein
MALLLAARLFIRRAYGQETDIDTHIAMARRPIERRTDRKEATRIDGTKSDAPPARRASDNLLGSWWLSRG